jgi:hypothetical protein
LKTSAWHCSYNVHSARLAAYFGSLANYSHKLITIKMKRNFTLFAILLSANILIAQNAIQYNTFFSNGEFNFISEATNENVDHGAIGEWVTWNFDNLKEGKHTKNWFGEAVEPIQSMNPEYFENADLCLRTENGINKFWQHDEAGLSYLGYETETSLLVLSDPLVHMPYPFVLGQNHTDVGKGDLYGTCSDSKWVCDLEAEVVGVGTLYLPNATFENAFKVRREVSITKTSLKTGNDKLYTANVYLWYVNGVSGPVMEIKEWERDICYGQTQGKE